MSEHGAEFYPTPTDALLMLLESKLVRLPIFGEWLEPCAGVGRIIEVSQRLVPDARWTAVEIDRRFDDELCRVLRPGEALCAGNFLEWDWRGKLFDLCIMNPPFSLAREFVERALLCSRRVVMLQRSGWFSGTKRPPHRDEWLREFCPDKYTLPRRPSFTPNGKTDSTEYCWYDWPTSRPRREGRHFMLDLPITHQLQLGVA